MRAAAARGLTHLAITDHDRIDGALEARDAAATEAPGSRSSSARRSGPRAGDLIGVFLREPIPPGLSPAEAIAAVREQGGLVGIAHPFDRFRGSLGPRRDDGARGAGAGGRLGRGVERAAHVGDGNARAAELAARLGVPGVAVSDAHTTLEVGVAYDDPDRRPVDAGRPAGRARRARSSS